MKFNTFQNRKPLKSAKQLGWSLFILTDLLKDDSRNVRKIKKSDYLENGHKPIIDQGKQLIGGYTNLDEGFYNEESYIVFGDHTRIIKYIDFPSFIGADGVKVLRNKNKNIVDTKYLYYFLQSINIPNAGYSRHFKFLKEVIVPVPPLNVQLQIVKTISKVHSITKKRDQQIEALSALKRSVFFDMFGDPNSTDCKYAKKRIGEVFEVQTGKTPSRKRIDYWDKEEVPWIKTTEVQNVEINTNEEFITNLAMTENKLKLFPENTILIAMYGQGKTRGQSGILKFPATCNQACAALLPSEEMEMKFVWNQLLIQYDSLRALGRGGNQPNLNLSLVRDFEIIVPPNDIQKKYADKVNKIDESIQEIENSLGQLTTLYDSLLHKAFDGELFKEEINA